MRWVPRVPSDPTTPPRPAVVLRLPTDDAATEFVLRPRGWLGKIAEMRLPTGG